MLNRSHRHSDARGETVFSPLPADFNEALIAGGAMRKERSAGEPTPLSVFVRRRLSELNLKQSDFCRLTGFDQGLLSKIQNSVITSLSLESTLRLALGLSVSPRVIFGLTERDDLQELVMRAYALDFFPELSKLNGAEIPGPVLEITTMASCAYSMGRSLAAAYAVMAQLSAVRRGSRENKTPSALLAQAFGT